MLKDVVTPEIYTHFLTLCCSIRILLSPRFCDQQVSYAKELLNYFVNAFPALYGKAQVSYNVHNLIHLTDDVNRYGALDSFSAFPFENFMKTIKKMLRKHDKPLEQIFNRIQETRNLKRNAKHFTADHCFTPKRPFDGLKNQLLPAYKSFLYKTFHFCGNSADDCILLKSGAYFLFEYVLTDLAQEIHIIGKQFQNTKSYFENPCDSKLIGVNVCSNLSKDLSSVSLQEIDNKCFKILMTDNTYLVLPLLHTISDAIQ